MNIHPKVFQITATGTILDSSAALTAEKVAWFAGKPCITSSGMLISAFQVGPCKNSRTSTLGLCKSYNKGEDWHRVEYVFETTINGSPGSLSNGEMIEVSPGNLVLLATWIDRSDPERPIFDNDTEGLLHTRILCAFSPNDGNSWSAWKEILIPSIEYSLHTSGPIVKLPDGRIVFAVESHKAFDETCHDVQSEGTWVIVSDDGARNFHGPYLVAQDPRQKVYYWDTRMCVSADSNSLFFLFWTHDRDNKRDIHVHSCLGHLASESFKTGILQETNMHGQIASPLMLENGRMFSLVVDREKPGTISLWENLEGVRWEKLGNIYVHENRDTPVAKMDQIEIKEIWENISKWNFGHPAVLALDNQTLFISFYAGEADHISLQWVKVRVA